MMAIIENLLALLAIWYYHRWWWRVIRDRKPPIDITHAELFKEYRKWRPDRDEKYRP
jgi:hypothetical protein